MIELSNCLKEEIMPSMEELLTENVEQAELIQNLLLENSELQQIVQEQKLTLQELKERIVTLNNSDLQLKKAEQTLLESKKMYSRAEALEQEVIEKDKRNQMIYEREVKELSARELSARKREAEARTIFEKQDMILNEKAEQLLYQEKINLESNYAHQETRLKNKYKNMEIQLSVITIGALMYSIFITLLSISMTKRFKTDFQGILEWLWNICVLALNSILNGANWVAQVGYKIPNQDIAVKIVWLIKMLVLVIAILVIMFCICFVIYKIYEIYRNNFADRVSACVLLVSLALLVWFGDYLDKIIPINLVVILLLINIVYLIVRVWLEKRYS